MFKLPKLTKKERAWVLYDIANSAFILTVITIFFPILYEMIYMAPHVASGISKYILEAGEEILNPEYTRLWIGTSGVTGGTQIFKYMTSILALVVAIISPMIGSWSNYKGNKRKFFIIFLAVAMIGGVGLAIPGYGWLTLLVIFFITSMGYNLTNVIYDAFLVDVTTEERFDEISATGFAWGYIGSLIPFFVGLIPYGLVLFGFVKPGFLGLDTFQLERLGISFAFLVSIAWWIYYSLPLLRDVEQTFELESGENDLKESLKRLRVTLGELWNYKHILLFLIAYLLYIDVVNSVIRLATNLGGDLGVGAMTMLGVVVMVQVVAFPSALLYGRLVKKFGNKRMIFYGILIYAIGVYMVYLIQDASTIYFMWIVGFLIGTAQGGIQSVSRSYYAKMVPYEKANDFFGFFSVFGRFAGIFSPFLIAFYQSESRLGTNKAVLLLLIPLAIASFLLIFVKPPVKEKAIEE
ncbi:Vacuole effluxer Atg22 like protein [Candidatus Izimaplasma bacterium HR1]|jgi:UMF1 family MFS transporter|uniref:MFS transporter n=1 Tax=Candidatus Izimoplasma sp. HR1 TaxID=1541959 RepID=UPI0004F60F31|nr:Vacuole effluxer Atg22 like protein [Candidatus Izimaplasma bacterium HR1]